MTEKQALKIRVVILCLVALFSQMTFATVTNREHNQFCRVTYNHYASSAYARENGGRMPPPSLGEVLLDGLLFPFRYNPRLGQLYRGCTQEINWLEDLRKHYCEQDSPIRSSRNSLPRGLRVPSHLVFLFDGAADFNAPAGHEMGAINLDGSEGVELGRGNFHGGGVFADYLGKDADILPTSRQLHYHASSGFHSRENYDSAHACFNLMDMYLDFAKKNKSNVRQPKLVGIGYSNGAYNILHFQDIANRANRPFNLLISIDPIPQAHLFAINKISSVIPARSSRTGRLINAFQNTDHSSIPGLHLRGRPVQNASVNIEVTHENDDYMKEDGHKNHVRIRKTETVKNMLECELKKLMNPSRRCSY